MLRPNQLRDYMSILSLVKEPGLFLTISLRRNYPLRIPYLPVTKFKLVVVI
jgi:hypothetical protein